MTLLRAGYYDPVKCYAALVLSLVLGRAERCGRAADTVLLAEHRQAFRESA